jgi:hypothetical protein
MYLQHCKIETKDLLVATDLGNRFNKRTFSSGLVSNADDTGQIQLCLRPESNKIRAYGQEEKHKIPTHKI